MKRPYVQTARARSVALTGERILDAALARFAAADYDEVTLDQVAVDAGVTVQTVLRRFTSKEGIVRALSERIRPQVLAQRGEAPVGDLAGAVANLVEHYELEGDLVLHLLRQELRVPAYAEVTARGRRLHADWCARVFTPWLDGLDEVERRRRTAQVVAVCDVHTWSLLRRQAGLSQRQVELALVELLTGVLP
ncbi:MULTISPECIES: TetR/AcrR family transcriptional regulator [unclassified Nocardioides]|uniref:TetR/AcrR family transcriptional regulator n=1 Tax=unclassified Nocardioides TaxID=2615069 RepID=UPI0000EB62CA|nr:MULTISPECIES: TetR/AcrR family transcriptional regulator [unclassified Nocardioides]ABL82467.1 transcriptional regulator, TetR family [Nocardioides sp. JS614]